jgi:hypothetical protein
MDDTRKISQGQLLTSLGKPVDSWASRETSASFDFFDRLVLRDTGIFLIGALEAFGDFTAGSTSGMGSSSAVISSAEGAVVASLFGSSSSLQRKQKEAGFVQLKKGKKSKHNKIVEYTEHLRCHVVEQL